MCLLNSRNSKKASVFGVEREAKDGAEGHQGRITQGKVRTLDSLLFVTESHWKVMSRGGYNEVLF